jgi:serine/threonine protein kinase
MVGRTIGGKLRVVGVLGEGGVGVVYLAEHEVLDRLFAVKVLRREMASDRIAVERFHREARAASRLQHRNIVYISDFGQLRDGRFYLVMEYIDGEGLGEVVFRAGPLDLARVCRIMLQVLDAVGYAHEQGVVHRDLKPENIILAEQRGYGELVKVLDFGLAKLLFGRLSPITFKGQMFGTPECMAPEQIAGQEVDHRVDIYALGVLTFELLCGRPPFLGKTMEQLMAHRKTEPPRPSEIATDRQIPEELDELVLKAMAKSPAERYGSSEEMATVFRRLLRDHAVGPDDEEPGIDAWSGVAQTWGEELEGSVLGPSGSRPAGAAGDSLARRSLERRTHPVGPAESEEVAPEEGKGSSTSLTGSIRKQLYALTQQLRDRGVGGARLTQQLARCMDKEERLLEHRTEVASLRSRMEELEAAGRQRESRLRYAIIDLGMEKSRLEAASSPQSGEGDGNGPLGEQREERNVIMDLDYQIRELEQRLQEVAKQRDAELVRLESEVRKHRRRAERAGEELASQAGVLLESVLEVEDELQTLESDGPARSLLVRLDELGVRGGEGLVSRDENDP